MKSQKFIVVAHLFLILLISINKYLIKNGKITPNSFKELLILELYIVDIFFDLLPLNLGYLII